MFKYYSINDTKTLDSSFVCVPKSLFTSPNLKNISTDAKMLYSVLLDRVSLSLKNKLVDAANRIYIIFKQTNIMELLNCSKQKAIKLFKELEISGLIERKRQGLNKPDMIYVKKIESSESKVDTPEVAAPDENKEFPQDSENTNEAKPALSKPDKTISCHAKNQNHTSSGHLNHTSGGTLLEPLNKTDKNIKTDKARISINQSINQNIISNNTNEKNKKNDDGLIDYNHIIEVIKKQIDYNCLIYNYDKNLLDIIISVMGEVYSCKNKNLFYKKYHEQYDIVKYKFTKLTMFEIEYVLDCIIHRDSDSSPIRNIKRYVMICLYNANETKEWYYNEQIGKYRQGHKSNSQYRQKFKTSGIDLSIFEE